MTVSLFFFPFKNSSSFLKGPLLFLNNFRFLVLRIKEFQTGQLLAASNPIRLGFTRMGLIFFHRSVFGQFRSQLRFPSLKSSILRLKGIGYKCWRKGTGLFFDLSKSHFFCLRIPNGLTILIRRRRGIILLSSDSSLVSDFSLKIRAFARPNPYTGKGVRFLGEFKKLKPGKQRR